MDHRARSARAHSRAWCKTHRPTTRARTTVARESACKCAGSRERSAANGTMRQQSITALDHGNRFALPSKHDAPRPRLLAEMGVTRRENHQPLTGPDARPGGPYVRKSLLSDGAAVIPPRSRRPLAARPPREGAQWLSSAEAAGLLGISPVTLGRWRTLGVGPAFSRVGPRFVRYARADVERWLGAPVRSTTAADALPSASVRLGAPRRGVACG